MTWAIEEKSCSQRRACGLIGLDPKTYRYASRWSDDMTIRNGARFLASPWRIWQIANLEVSRKVTKLTFADRLVGAQPTALEPRKSPCPSRH